MVDTEVCSDTLRTLGDSGLLLTIYLLMEELFMLKSEQRIVLEVLAHSRTEWLLQMLPVETHHHHH
jgi:hypothetical protein